MDIYRESMDIQGYPWISMDIHELCVDAHGYLRGSNPGPGKRFARTASLTDLCQIKLNISKYVLYKTNLKTDVYEIFIEQTYVFH